MQFSDLGLAPELLQAIAEQGYTEATPVQQQAIPPILLGRDVMAAAQTGTGKTASFTLPMLQRLRQYASASMSPARHPVRALILTPTRELAAQVEASARTYGKHIPLRVASVFGGVPIGPQIDALRAGVEILVATPGRLLDHVQSKTVMFHAVSYLVLDEADRMLDMGFLPDIKRIIAMLPAARQTLLFSATYSDEIRAVTKQWLRDPVQVEVAARNSVTDMVTHTVFKVDSKYRREALVNLLRARDMRQVLVFCNTKIGANRLAYRLQKDGLGAAAIHSDRSQAERMQALAEFKEGKVQILVATDIAARGLDIEQLPFVVNFDLPLSPEDYVHRIGRTGRAGLTGEAISLVGAEDHEKLAAIEKLINVKLPLAELPAEPQRQRRETSQHREASRQQERSGKSRPVATSSRPPSADPLFDSPYQASHQPKSESTRSVTPLVSGRKQKNRQVAALFLPPVEKQDA